MRQNCLSQRVGPFVVVAVQLADDLCEAKDVAHSGWQRLRQGSASAG